MNILHRIFTMGCTSALSIFIFYANEQFYAANSKTLLNGFNPCFVLLCIEHMYSIERYITLQHSTAQHMVASTTRILTFSELLE
jgi:hypothetical protein